MCLNVKRKFGIAGTCLGLCIGGTALVVCRSHPAMAPDVKVIVRILRQPDGTMRKAEVEVLNRSVRRIRLLTVSIEGALSQADADAGLFVSRLFLGGAGAVVAPAETKTFQSQFAAPTAASLSPGGVSFVLDGYASSAWLDTPRATAKVSAVVALRYDGLAERAGDWLRNQSWSKGALQRLLRPRVSSYTFTSSWTVTEESPSNP